VNGYVPFVAADRAVEEARAVPGAQETLLRELEQTQPPVIVDSAASLGGRSMRHSPRLREYLDGHYCPLRRRVDGLQLYVRHQGDAPCPTLRRSPQVGEVGSVRGMRTGALAPPQPEPEPPTRGGGG
jgi:hypothetical protein